jgi:hypothetical protein
LFYDLFLTSSACHVASPSLEEEVIEQAEIVKGKLHDRLKK